MDLEKKATILFPPRLYEHLGALARQRGVSVGQLVRDACVAQYGSASRDARTEAARALAELSLPVGPVEQLVLESTSPAEDLP